jgi:hypothetical protein
MEVRFRPSSTLRGSVETGADPFHRSILHIKKSPGLNSRGFSLNEPSTVGEVYVRTG